MLARVFKLDVTHCQKCGGDMKAVCSVMKQESVIRYLKHVGLDYEPPPRAPPRYHQPELDFNQVPADNTDPIHSC